MELVIRATVIYWFLWLLVRGSGKRTLSDLTPLDLLVTIVIGDIVQQGITQEDMSVTGAVIVTCTFMLWTLLGDALARRSKAAEGLLDGQPVVVVRNGEPDLDRLHRERLSLSDLLGAAREAGFADLADIRTAVLEDDGRFSFIRADDQPGRS
jgi:uncharacterized membrane protein YcaP (DUF421 family)